MYLHSLQTVVYMGFIFLLCSSQNKICINFMQSCRHNTIKNQWTCAQRIFPHKNETFQSNVIKYDISIWNLYRIVAVQSEFISFSNAITLLFPRFRRKTVRREKYSKRSDKKYYAFTHLQKRKKYPHIRTPAH